jgi:hypothetical protein
MKRELPPSTGHEHHQHAMDTLCVAIYTGIHCCLAYIVSIPRDGGGEGGGMLPEHMLSRGAREL